MKSIFLLWLLLGPPAGDPSDYDTPNVLRSGDRSPEASIEDVGWISGHWRGELFGGVGDEVWLPADGRALVGVFRLVLGGRVSLYELLTIVEVDDSLELRLKHFSADFRGWEEPSEFLRFPLVKLEKDRAWFGGMTFVRQGDELTIYFTQTDEDGSVREERFIGRVFQ